MIENGFPTGEPIELQHDANVIRQHRDLDLAARPPRLTHPSVILMRCGESIVGEDERQIAHLLHRKTFRMHLENVHAGAFDAACVRFSNRGREENSFAPNPIRIAAVTAIAWCKRMIAPPVTAGHGIPI